MRHSRRGSDNGGKPRQHKSAFEKTSKAAPEVGGRIAVFAPCDSSPECHRR